MSDLIRKFCVGSCAAVQLFQQLNYMRSLYTFRADVYVAGSM
jgi:hypothetical protein